MSQARIQESMKSALMRGVCALNLETMSVLQPESECGSPKGPLHIEVSGKIATEKCISVVS